MTSHHEEAPSPPTSQLWTVDQINDQSASVEVDGTTTMVVPLWILPKNVQEGDVLRVKHDLRIDRSILMIVTDDEERRRRLAQSTDQVSVQSKNDMPGNIVL